MQFLIQTLAAILLLGRYPATTAAPMQLYGVNYSLRIGPDWTYGDDRCKNRERVRKDLQQLKGITNRIRVYTMIDCDSAALLMDLTAELGMEVWLGIWVGPDKTVFPEERARLLELLEAGKSFDNVSGIHVSSEAIYREEITAEDAIELRNIIAADLVKYNVDIPVTIADIIDSNLIYPELISADPKVVTFNQFPFWERQMNINSAAYFMSDRVQNLMNQAGGRQIIVSETGWADAGANEYANVANPESMAKWLSDFVCLADARGWGYYWFIAYDSDWRRINEELPDDVEGHFGLFTQDGTLKPHLANLDIDCSEPQVDLDLSMLAPIAPAAPVAPTQPAPTQAPVKPPTKQPIKAPTNQPVAQPTRSPVADPTEQPVKPLKAATDVNVPTDYPVKAPTKSPVKQNQQQPTTTKNGGSTTDANSINNNNGPTTTAAPETNSPVVVSNVITGASSNNDAQCSRNEVCANLELTGACCPTVDGVNLACCSGGTTAIQGSCQRNDACAELGLEGECCPAPPPPKNNGNEVYLDCCNAVPDRCLDGTNCEIYSAREYISDMAGSTSGAVSYASFAPVAVLVSIGVVAAAAVAGF